MIQPQTSKSKPTNSGEEASSLNPPPIEGQCFMETFNGSVFYPKHSVNLIVDSILYPLIRMQLAPLGGVIRISFS